MPIISGVSLTVQCLMLSNNIDHLSAELIVKDKRINFVVLYQLIEEPSEDIRLKARLQHANKQIFDLIQSVQQNDKRMESLEALKALDREVDMYVASAMKIKDREARRELMD